MVSKDFTLSVNFEHQLGNRLSVNFSSEWDSSKSDFKHGIGIQFQQ